MRITERGKEVLAQSPERTDNTSLMQFDEFRQFLMRSRQTDERKREDASGESFVTDPVEEIERVFSNYQEMLIEELKETIHHVSPAFFERLVVQLLTKMGYGSRSMQAATVVGGSGDEGIDSIINEDKLGLDVIYVQAKKWDNPVGRPEIQKFVGALHGKRARKGVFLTTSTFSREAQEYVRHLRDPKVVLIDGEELTRLTIEYNVGVTLKATYELKSVDRDFFEEVS